MMTVGHILDEINRIKECREKLQNYIIDVERDINEFCELFHDNPTNVRDTFHNALDILANLELLFRTKINTIEVDI